MNCPACDAPTVRFSVPDALDEYAPAETVAVCTECLNATAAEEPPAEPPTPRHITDALPADADVALALVLVVDRLDSLASNRSEIESLLAFVEQRGGDPILAFERLAADPDVSPAVDLARRSRQLEQLRS